MTEPITKEERKRIQEKAENVAYIAKNGIGEIKWDDGTITPAGDQPTEDSIMCSYAVMFVDPLFAYEAALQAAEARIAKLEAALKPFAEMANNIVAQIPDDDRVPIDFVQGWGDEKDSVSVEAFRRARAALGETDENAG